MKVCFVGIGSIAKRHIKNLCDICKERNIDITIDALRRNNMREIDFPKAINEIYTSISCLPSDYDIIFLTNPTEYHADMLCKLHEKAKHFFVEKPIATLNTLDKVSNIKYRSDSVYYVACPLRYTKIIQYIKNNIDIDTVKSVRCISSSYLPDWRPGVDYRDTYSAHKELGGGVDLDLIHEWDYLTYLFGLPTKLKMFSGKISDLEIDSNDYAIYIAEYSNKMIAELHLDYFGRNSIRKIELLTDKDTIVCDLIDSVIKYMNSGRVFDFSEKRDDFQKRELECFIDMINKRKKSSNDILNAIKVLNLTQGFCV